MDTQDSGKSEVAEMLQQSVLEFPWLLAEMASWGRSMWGMASWGLHCIQHLRETRIPENVIDDVSSTAYHSFDDNNG